MTAYNSRRASPSQALGQKRSHAKMGLRRRKRRGLRGVADRIFQKSRAVVAGIFDPGQCVHHFRAAEVGGKVGDVIIQLIGQRSGGMMIGIKCH